MLRGKYTCVGAHQQQKRHLVHNQQHQEHRVQRHCRYFFAMPKKGTSLRCRCQGMDTCDSDHPFKWLKCRDILAVSLLLLSLSSLLMSSVLKQKSSPFSNAITPSKYSLQERNLVGRNPPWGMLFRGVTAKCMSWLQNFSWCLENTTKAKSCQIAATSCYVNETQPSVVSLKKKAGPATPLKGELDSRRSSAASLVSDADSGPSNRFGLDKGWQNE